MNKRTLLSLSLLWCGGALAAEWPSAAQIAAMTDAQRHELASKTEVWTPVPPVVTVAPGQDKATPPPSDALVLLGTDAAADLTKWRSVTTGGAAEWSAQQEELTVKPGTGDIRTKQSFCDIQLHLEWRTPTPDPAKTGQMRNNSGIFLQDLYEIQILDVYQNPTYPNGQTGAVYKQTMPLANAMRPAGQWQVYDIIYRAPRFNGGQLQSPGYVTVLHNGVLLQNHTEIAGTTEWIGPPQQRPHGCAPLKLQDHGDLISFRNIWLRQLN